MKKSKRYQTAKGLVDHTKLYNLEEAIGLVKKMPLPKFDQTLEISLQLNINPKKTEQNVRGSVILPYGIGKTKRVVAIANPEKQKEAISAGADLAGGEEIVEKISHGWLDFDAVVATPDMMKIIAKVGKILGPRGLMPTPKLGTVTFQLGEAIKEIKAGKVEFKNDAGGVIHAGIGKVSFSPEQLAENVRVFVTGVIKCKPATVRGKYLKNVSICATMSPGIRINVEGISE